MHLKSATLGTIKSAGTGLLENRTYSQEVRKPIMAATTKDSLNDENAERGGSGTRAHTNNNNNNNNSSSNNNNNNNSNISTNNNNNHNNDDSNNSNQPVMDEVETKLKRQTLEQRKQELEQLLSEKNWLLQQIQKQETQILNGNYEYLNVNEIFAMLARQYKKEHGANGGGAGGDGGHDTGSTAILRRKTISGSGCKENHVNHNNNNNNNNNNRQSDISNRSSEYDNYPGGNSGISESNTIGVSAGVAQQQIAKSQSMKKRGTPTPIPTSTSAIASYNYLHTQQRQQQLLQQQMLQNHLQYAALMQHQHYHHQQQQLHQQQQQLHQQQQQQQQQLHQQQQQQQLHQQQQQQQQQLHQQQQQQLHNPPKHKQQVSPSQSHSQSRHYPADAISLYSVNSASVATMRQQHIAPQQQPIVVQCDRYYLSPTHQSYNDGGFIKSSQNIKKYVSPMSSPTQHMAAAQQHTQQYPLQAHHYQQELLLIPAAAATEHQRQHNQQQQQPQQQQQHHQFLTLQQLQPHILLQPPQHAPSRQLDAISLAPSYISVDVENVAAHNLRWRSQSNLPPISPHTPTHSGLGHSQMAADSKSHSSDMLSSNAYYNTSAALQAASIKSLSKPLDEISISSMSSDTQKSKQPRPKQWLESSLDGPVIRQAQSSLGGAVHSQEVLNSTTASVRLPTTKADSSMATLGVGVGLIGARERVKLSSQSMSGATRHYSMSATTQKHPFAHPKLLQDDDGRYAKLSQSTSYLNNMDTPSISAAYPLDGAINSTNVELPPPPTAFQYLPPKPSTAVNTVSQLSPPPRPPPIGDKVVGAGSVAVATIGVGPSALSPTDIRIESPKNITIVKPATFRPYQEETKPFEMSDFYKYSTKFRQKESSSAANLE